MAADRGNTYDKMQLVRKPRLRTVSHTRKSISFYFIYSTAKPLSHLLGLIDSLCLNVVQSFAHIL